MQETEAYLLAYQLLQKPEEWDNHLRRANASLVLSIIYGLPPMLDSMNPDIKRVNHFVERALSSGCSLELFWWSTSRGWNTFLDGCTSSQMAWVILSMILYPEVQKKAQMELDRVVGRDRLPSFQDLDHLPYIHSILKEIMRWRGVGPLGIPHRLNTDDYYEGYYLPKDTIVVANAWALNHDPDVWGPDADDFKPERHLDDNGQLKPALRDTHEESHVTYGYGTSIASLLWAFDLSPCENRNGEGIPDPNKFLDEGLVVRPHHFPCVIEPRFNGVGEAILQTLDSKGQATETR
ncbi:hypothetical protein VNI00_006578 [Paramarasmius palmivorus]|uniref:Cytochrome P450 n=1 Tax=Paramarasmius palmivorus TaxID=297713 RepID=A0AAW0DAU6_9AGAR